MKKTLHTKNKIIFSVVVCTYNREMFIKKCLNSLINLDFPKNTYEIIVVDDGSTDATVDIVKKYPVKLIIHKKNQGIAAARNTGLKHAKGKIYVCFDDDCFVSKDWLKNLAQAYEQSDLKKTLGIAGFIKLVKGNNGFIDKYMYETGYGNPSPTYFVNTNNIFFRFGAYLKNMYFPSNEKVEKMSEVGEIWGANCSFFMHDLKAVKGWDENLSGVEDTDLCKRLIKKFKNKKFFCTKDAILYHDHKLSLARFIKKPFSRGEAILRFYMKSSKFPPIFPFPVFIFVIFFAVLFFSSLYAVVLLLILPQLFYGRYFLKAVKEKKEFFLVFPYLQFLYELSAILGLMSGFTKIKSL